MCIMCVDHVTINGLIGTAVLPFRIRTLTVDEDNLCMYKWAHPTSRTASKNSHLRVCLGYDAC
jgi:hypothetical protein